MITLKETLVGVIRTLPFYFFLSESSSKSTLKIGCVASRPVLETLLHLKKRLLTGVESDRSKFNLYLRLEACKLYNL